MIYPATPVREQSPPVSDPYRIALIRWDSNGGGIGEAIYQELANLGHAPFYVAPSDGLRQRADVLFLFGPFGRYLELLRDLPFNQAGQRPYVVFWNTEGLPDLRLPWSLMSRMAVVRSWLGRCYRSAEEAAAGGLPTLLARFDQRLMRFRYLGDLLYARSQGWIDLLADISAVYAQLFSAHGLPTLIAPFGGFPEWHADLKLERDIDVLWMGKRATQRRSKLLDGLRAELRRRGTDIYMVDNVERPFVFERERTHLLNRTKITLNLLRTWYDENSLRFCMAASNRSLIVSEPLLPHVPEYQTGVHYVSATVEQLADTIDYYLHNAAERAQIVEQSYQLVTNDLTMRSSIGRIMTAVTRHERLAFRR